MLLEFIDRGLFEPNLVTVCDELAARRDAMLETLEPEFPQGSLEPSRRRLLPLARPPDWRRRGASVEASADGGRRRQFVKGTDFFAGAGGEESVRLAFSFASVDEIREGVRRLGALVRDAAAVAV